jgi:methylglutaconyl-CoA hydratase
MKKYEFILIEKVKDIVWIILNRPDKGNALNIVMIRELIHSINVANGDISCRFIIISSKNKSFCSGADLKWMAEAAKLTVDQNLSECLDMAELYNTIYNSKNIVITLISGACIGGGIGIAAASDFCISADTSYFQFSEVKIGLIPATISPYVIQRIGNQKTKRLMLTGETINAQQALDIGLVDILSDPLNTEKSLESLLNNLRLGGKEAQYKIKELVNQIGPLNINSELKKFTSEFIAAARVSEEGQKGLKTFLEKRNRSR